MKEQTPSPTGKTKINGVNVNELLFILFLILIIAGVLETGTISSVNEKFGLDIGYVSFIPIAIISVISEGLATIVGVILNMVLSIWIVYIPFAIYFYKKSRPKENH